MCSMCKQQMCTSTTTIAIVIRAAHHTLAGLALTSGTRSPHIGPERRIYLQRHRHHRQGQHGTDSRIEQLQRLRRLLHWVGGRGRTN